MQVKACSEKEGHVVIHIFWSRVGALILEPTIFLGLTNVSYNMDFLKILPLL